MVLSGSRTSATALCIGSCGCTDDDDNGDQRKASVNCDISKKQPLTLVCNTNC